MQTEHDNGVSLSYRVGDAKGQLTLDAGEPMRVDCAAMNAR
jgi:hypothetical protein